MLDDFNDLRLRELVLLDRLAQLGTITAAAVELGVPKPTASRWLAQLEARCGCPLLHRGARRVTLTERGRGFLDAAQPVLRSARALRAAAQEDRPGGVLRVSVPVPLGRLVGGQVIAAFRRSMPGVRLEVLLDNARVDLVRDRVDLAIRGGEVTDPELVARRLTEVPLRLYVGVSWRSEPLEDVPLITAPGDLRLLAGRAVCRPPAVVVDDRTAVAAALAAGAGAGVLPAFLGQPLADAGELVAVEGATVATVPVFAVFLPEQRRDVRLRCLVELVEEQTVSWRTG